MINPKEVADRLAARIPVSRDVDITLKFRKDDQMGCWKCPKCLATFSLSMSRLPEKAVCYLCGRVYMLYDPDPEKDNGQRTENSL